MRRDAGAAPLAGQDRRERPLVASMARADQAATARAAILARLERQVDPAGSLAPGERATLVGPLAVGSAPN